MSGKNAVPDAWDDDWETIADVRHIARSVVSGLTHALSKKQEIPSQNQTPEPPARLSKAERKAKHVEANKQLWDAAESPERPIFLQARENVPLTSEFKPAMKVLSRKPPPAKVAEASRAMGGLSIADEDSEEEERRRNAESFAERQARAQKEREEKQRKYLEVRERLFGTPASGSEEAPSRSSSKNGQHSTSRNSSRGKGRGKGDIDGHASSADQSPARASTQKRQLYDPNYTSKPQSAYVQRTSGANSRPETPGEEQHIRQPKGPDSSGRGGFGFTARGNRVGSST
ncbi:hypothetical protein NA57DRAFT_60265 [Rhizodiscina lignyota]|uniref:SUZ domain-containing protein n=1 Tax=Rhizodiscina lignyota TaxID=1504668 RepID=A0A9P4M6H9_9PEZI|nr:hypothetical protein NA57DRAFT_60265 [Rhizodiscina lignyota]